MPHEAFSAGLTDDGDEEKFGADGEVGCLDSLLDEHSGGWARDVEVGEEEEQGVLFLGHGRGGLVFLGVGEIVGGGGCVEGVGVGGLYGLCIGVGGIFCADEPPGRGEHE